MKIQVYVLKTENKLDVANKVVDLLKYKIGNLKNKKILVKPNCVGGYNPEKGVTTNPELVFNICSKLEEGKSKITMGDCHGGNPGTVESVFKKSGFLPLCNKWFKNIGSNAIETKFICRPNGKVHLCNVAINSDIVISVAKFKSSCYMIMSAAVKNLYGTIPGTQKAKIHEELPGRDDFANMLIELSEKPKLTIAVIDGSTVMEGDGPVHGTLREENIYIISESIYAADYVAGKMMGLLPEHIPTVKASLERGLLNIEEVEIITDINDIVMKNFKLPITLSSYINGIVDSVDETVKQISSIKIIIDNDKCVACRQCFEHCPVKAISMEPKPVIDHNKCIRCFCCNELCSFGAALVESDIQSIWDKTMKSETEKIKID